MGGMRLDLNPLRPTPWGVEQFAGANRPKVPGYLRNRMAGGAYEVARDQGSYGP
jgi:hypothetical protein